MPAFRVSFSSLKTWSAPTWNSSDHCGCQVKNLFLIKPQLRTGSSENAFGIFSLHSQTMGPYCELPPSQTRASLPSSSGPRSSRAMWPEGQIMCPLPEVLLIIFLWLPACLVLFLLWLQSLGFLPPSPKPRLHPVNHPLTPHCWASGPL